MIFPICGEHHENYPIYILLNKMQLLWCDLNIYKYKLPNKVLTLKKNKDISLDFYQSGLNKMRLSNRLSMVIHKISAELSVKFHRWENEQFNFAQFAGVMVKISFAFI